MSGRSRVPKSPSQFRLPLGRGKDESRVIVGVPKESYPGERRVALVPVAIPNLIKAGLSGHRRNRCRRTCRLPGTRCTSTTVRRLCPIAQPYSAGADIVVQVLCYGSNDVTGKADLTQDA